MSELDQVKDERDRLAAEVERLKEQILDHDCPSFSMCPKHTGNRELEECPYCTIERLTARWERLFGNLRDRRLTLFGYSAEQQVAIEDVFTAAVELMAALEREED